MFFNYDMNCKFLQLQCARMRLGFRSFVPASPAQPELRGMQPENKNRKKKWVGVLDGLRFFLLF